MVLDYWDFLNILLIKNIKNIHYMLSHKRRKKVSKSAKVPFLHRETLTVR
jgi:hypothetical protein